jgi:serine/threonine-protein kinase
VAVKVLDPQLAESLGAERFLREIKTVANLTHPHILPLYDSGEADGFLFYVMPYVKGESLRARLTKEKQLPVADAVQIAGEIAGALAYAHKEGVVHRDVKPANIMLEEGHAVLADFGVAHAVSEAKDDRITKLGFSPGTPSYMSPEQASGERSVDGRSDQYALGCVLYEMLSGEPPFTGSTPAAILARHVHDRVPALGIVRPNLPAGLTDALDKALAKVPADRHQDSGEFRKALHLVITGEIAAVSRPPSISLVRKLAWAGVIPIAAFGLFQLITDWPWSGPSTPGTLGRIAVTYFDDNSEGGALGYLADALTQHVNDGLEGLGTLEVLTLNAMKPYREGGLTTEGIEQLQIDAYVEGAVMGTPDRAQASVQLIDARDLSHINSQVVEGTAGQSIEMLADLAEEVSGLLRQWLGVRMELMELQAGTESGLAWNLVQQANRKLSDAIDLHASGDTASARRTLSEADDVLARAEAEDNSYVTPIVDRGWVASEMARLGTSQVQYDTAWALVGLEHADRAIDKEEDHARAWELRGFLLDYLASESGGEARADSLREEAAFALGRATDLDGSRAGAYARLSRIFEDQGRDAEAKLAARQAYEADPYQLDARVILFRLCSTSMSLKIWSEVERWCGEGSERFPTRASFPSALLAALAGPEGPEPDVDLAWQMSDQVIRLSEPHMRPRRIPTHHLQVAAVIARAGMPDSARAVMARSLDDPNATSVNVHVFEANARLRLGDVDGALDALERFLLAVPGARADAATEWWWEELWDHPRFKEIVGTAGGSTSRPLL